MNDFGLLVGRHFTSFPTLSDTQLSELMLDASGRLIISGRYLEDSAHTSGDAGLFMMGVRNDADASLTDADGDYSPIAVDEFGRVKVVADLDVDFDYVYAEDSAHASGDNGAYVLAVRQDTLASSTSTDGDYASFKVNALGELYVHDTDANASLDAIASDVDAIRVEQADQGLTLDAIDTSLNNIEASVAQIDLDLDTTNSTLATIDTSLNNIEADIDSLTKLEDSAHVSGDAGIMPLAVRNDAGTPLAADGDYIPFTTDATGALRTATQINPVGAEQYTVTDALAAAGDGLATITAATTPWVTVASFAHASGVAYVYGWQWACDQNADARIVTDDTTDVIVYKRAINSSGQPTWAEHWNDGGRIEIPGAADLEIKLQIKKRSATGGNALGTGSLHIRK